MLAKLNTFTLIGIDAVPVEAEVGVSSGLTAFNAVVEFKGPTAKVVQRGTL
jgi:hypothetical protein